MRAPPDSEERRLDQPALSNTLTAAQTRKVDDSVPHGAVGVVVDLDDHRARRLLADLDLLPTVQAPCTGCCTCFGTPLGAGCRS